MAQVVFDFKPGDVVWFMYKDCAVCGTVKKLWAAKFISCVNFTDIIDSKSYSVCIGGNDKYPESFDRDKLFLSKDELLKSL